MDAQNPSGQIRRFSKASLTVTVVGLSAVLLLAGWLWAQQWDANPIVAVPSPRMPSPNAFDDYTAAGKALVDSNKIEAAYHQFHSAPSVSPAGSEALVAANAQALKTLRQGFTHPYRNPPMRSFQDLSLDYAPFSHLARLLTLEGQNYAAHQDWGGAVNSNLDAVRLGVDIPQGSVLIGALTGMADQATGRRAIWPLVNRLSAPDAGRAARRLEAIQAHQVPYVDMLQEEKWFGQAAMIERFRTSHWQSIDFWHSKRMSMRNYTRYMDQSIENARHPYAASHQKPPLPPDMMSSLLIPFAISARLRYTDNQAQNALMMTSLALRAYRLEHGNYPAALDVLAPAYLAHRPKPTHSRSPARCATIESEPRSCFTASARTARTTEVGPFATPPNRAENVTWSKLKAEATSSLDGIPKQSP